MGAERGQQGRSREMFPVWHPNLWLVDTSSFLRSWIRVACHCCTELPIFLDVPVVQLACYSFS